ncbi:MAG: GxxExxY protein [Rhodocyclaceae bacterium]
MESVNHEGHEDHEEKQDADLCDCPDSVVRKVLDAAIEVHRNLGPGLLESVYELALFYELSDKGIAVERQFAVPVFYRGRNLGAGFRADMLVEGKLLLELKSVDLLSPLHVAQTITYLRLLRLKRGLLLNSNARLLKDGIKRVSI